MKTLSWNLMMNNLMNMVDYKYNTPQIVGYLRVSSEKQVVANQRLVILDYAHSQGLTISHFVEVVISSRRAIAERKILETLAQLQAGDTLIVAELSRLGRSTVEILTLVQDIVAKGIVLVLIKENLRLNQNNHRDVTNTVMLTVFSMLANLERNLISQRTKEGLAERKARGIRLGKPKGTLQKSIYDPYLVEIKDYLGKGLSLTSVIKLLGVGQARSLHNYVVKRGLRK
jgi:DNA invertase Pin-like site-specific DNA recombinase